MLGFLSKYSITKKLMLLVLATASFVVFIALFITIVNNIKTAREAARSNLTVLADVVARNSASAIIFGDVGTANETLAALQADHSVLRAEILNNNNEVFASYVNTSHTTADWLHKTNLFGDMVIEREITQNGKTEGKIRVVADFDNVMDSLIVSAVVNSLGLIIAYLLGYMFLRKMIGFTLQPIKRLTEAMNEIIGHQQYTLRVEKTSEDELGELTDGFNQMLSQIELRDGRLRQSDEALSQTQEAIALRDENLCCQFVNPAFIVLFGYHLEELIGKPFSFELDSSSDSEPNRDEIYAIARESGSYRGEVTRRTKSGKIIPISLHVSPIRDASGKLTGYVSVSSDITEKKRAEEWIWRQANFDLLTGLPNRHMFQERLAHEAKLTQQTGQPFALMFLDLDDFKEVNDSLGHGAGDLLLKEVGERLKNCVRATDSVGHGNNIARLGGDEFTIILSNLKDTKSVDTIAKRILATLAEPFYLGEEVVRISVSIGITLCPDDADDIEALIKNADQTMYHAKNQGRNTYRYFTRSMQIAATKRREITTDLRTAIDEQQFRVLYQPIVDLATNKIHKAEALIRWEHPEHGTVSPVDFIPVAEDTGMIVEIGNWVFFEVAEQLAKWRTSIHDNFQISINKSPVQFRDKGNSHLEWFKHMQELDLPGSSLVVEITEGLMLDKNPEVSEKLLALRDHGVQVAVDDFGTGYSSLSYLKKFDIDYIKIDRSFVQNLSIESDDMVLCEAIIVMSHKLGLKVIAEGVETVEQRDLLFAVGCDYGQGYLFSRPIPAADMEALSLAQNDLGRDGQPAYEKVALAG